MVVKLSLCYVPFSLLLCRRFLSSSLFLFLYVKLLLARGSVALPFSPHPFWPGFCSGSVVSAVCNARPNQEAISLAAAWLPKVVSGCLKWLVVANLLLAFCESVRVGNNDSSSLSPQPDRVWCRSYAGSRWSSLGLSSKRCVLRWQPQTQAVREQPLEISGLGSWWKSVEMGNINEENGYPVAFAERYLMSLVSRLGCSGCCIIVIRPFARSVVPWRRNP